MVAMGGDAAPGRDFEDVAANARVLVQHMGGTEARFLNAQVLPRYPLRRLAPARNERKRCSLRRDARREGETADGGGQRRKRYCAMGDVGEKGGGAAQRLRGACRAIENQGETPDWPSAGEETHRTVREAELGSGSVA